MDDKPTLPRGVEEVLVRYFRAADEGRPIPPADLLAAYPHLASQLAAFFSGEEELRNLPRGDVSALPTSPPAALLQEEEGIQDFGDLIALEELGSGGMGIVYRVRDSQLDRDLAVKVLRSCYLRDEDMRRRFTEEARIGAQLQHPGVVPVHAFGTLPGNRPFFTMKLVRGRTFAALLSERASPRDELPRFLGIFGQVCRTVAYAHTHGVIHRDLKPLNVMVGAFGEVQVMDWGLAKILRAAASEPARTASRVEEPALEGLTPRTHTGKALGTLAYMPPEQARGEVRDQDQRSDVFALGAILCEILTGGPPYTDTTRDLFRQVRTGEVSAALGRLNVCGADPELIQIAERCLAVERADRPADAAEVANAMQRYEDGLRERLRQTELERTAAAAREAEAVRTVRAERRAKRRNVALAILLVLVVSGGGALAWHLQQQQTQRRTLHERDFAAEVSATEALLREGWQLTTAPERWAAVLRSARMALERAERLRAEADGNDNLEQPLRQTRGALEEAERSQRLVTACEQVRTRMARSTGGDWNQAEVSTGYRQAFDREALDILHADIAVLAQRLGTHPVREQLLDELLFWLTLAPESGDRRRLSEVIQAVDPAPQSFRRRLCEILARSDGQALLELARSEEAGDLSPTRVCALAGTLMIAGRTAVVSTEGRPQRLSEQFQYAHLRGEPMHYAGRTEGLALLRRACTRHPGEFWLHLDLALFLDSNLDSERPEALVHATAAVALRPESASAHYTLGRICEVNSDLEQAAAWYQRAIALDPGEVRARSYLGAILLTARHQPEEALAQFEAILETAPTFAGGHYGKGLVLSEQGKLTEAMAAFRRAVEYEPDNYRTHRALALTLEKQGNHTEALAEARLAATLSGDAPYEQMLLAACLGITGKLDEAIAIFEHLLAQPERFSPGELADAYRGLGLTYCEKKDYPAALKNLTLASRLEPRFKADLAKALALSGGTPQHKAAVLREAADVDGKNEALQFELSKALSQLGREDEALAACRKGLAINDRSADGYAALGTILCRKKQWQEGIDALTRALSLDPNSGFAHLVLGEAYTYQGNAPRALEELQKGLEKFPNDPGGLNCLAQVQEKTGDLTGAIATRRQVLRLNPTDVAPRIELAATLLRKGDYPGAAAEFQKVIDQDPANYQAYGGLGRARQKDHDLEGARRAFQQAFTIKKDPGALYALVEVLVQLGDWREALVRYRELMKLQPSATAFAQAGRARCLLMLGDLEGAVQAAREAIHLNAKLVQGYQYLGEALLSQRHDQEAVTALREAVRLGPDDLESRTMLCGALLMSCRFAEAREEIREMLVHAPANYPQREVAESKVRICTRALGLQERIPAILAGAEPPHDALDLALLATLCNTGEKRHPVAAVRFFRAAFAARPESLDIPREIIHRLAASSAAQAAAGDGEDAGALDAAERAALRRQALEWLRVDLARWEAIRPHAAAERFEVRTGVNFLLLSPELASVREAAELDHLSAEERAEWQEFWKAARNLVAQLD